MKSKTLSSDLTLFKKDITRFSPLWLIWSMMYVICGYMLYSSGHDLTDRYEIFPVEFTIGNIIYGIGCAVTLFGYLSDTRECISVHSLPIRRENQFLVHLLSGFAMHIIPSALFCLSILPLCNGNVFAMFCFMVMQFVFYFGLGIFCVMLTGRKFAAVAMFGLINFAAMLTYLAVDIIYIPFLPGIQLNIDKFMQFCPPACMMFKAFEYSRSWEMDVDFTAYTQVIAIFAAIGVALIIVSLVLYRIRKLESAERFMAFPGLNFLFVVICTLFCGCFFISFSSIITQNSYWAMLGFGILIGYFGSIMLLHRTPRVFYKKSLIGLVMITFVIVGSIFVTKMDPLGRVRYIPEPEDVERAELYYYEPSSSFYYTEDLEQITQLEQLHQDMITQGPPSDEYYETPKTYPQHMELLYHMKDGTTLKRTYNAVDDAKQQVYWYMSQPEYMLGASTLDELLEKTKGCDIHIFHPNEGYREDDPISLSEADMDALLKVVFDDCKAGNFSVDIDTDDSTLVYELEISIKPQRSDLNSHEAYAETSYLRIPPEAAASTHWIEQYIAAHPSETP